MDRMTLEGCMLGLHSKLILKGKMVCEKFQNHLKVTKDCFYTYVLLHFKIQIFRNNPSTVDSKFPKSFEDN